MGVALRIVLPLSLVFLYSASLFPQEVYSTLKKSQYVRSFTDVSNSLVCQCGCNFVLSLCPHVECPWGIPARRFIEEKVKQGFPAQQIIQGFKEGFGPDIYKESYTQKLVSHGYRQLVEELLKGYGPQISAKSSLFLPFLLLGLLSLGGLFIVLYWFRRNR